MACCVSRVSGGLSGRSSERASTSSVITGEDVSNKGGRGRRSNKTITVEVDSNESGESGDGSRRGGKQVTTLRADNKRGRGSEFVIGSSPTLAIFTGVGSWQQHAYSLDTNNT